MFNKTTPLIKRFKTKTFTASGTATTISPVELGEQRIQLHIQPKAADCVVKFNESDTTGLLVLQNGIYIIEGYQGPLYITGSGTVVVYEGVI
jgi:hypothetical protein